MKNECGEHFTTKVEQMFNDIQKSKELVNQFKAQNSKIDYEIDYKILEL